MLELQELVKHFPVVAGDPVRAVDGVSLSVSSGEFVALYGPSGSGKTTLLMLIAALLQPDAGKVLLDGREISRLNDRDAAGYRLNELGFIRQSLNLIPGASALDNAALKLMGTDIGARLADRSPTTADTTRGARTGDTCRGWCVPAAAPVRRFPPTPRAPAVGP